MIVTVVARRANVILSSRRQLAAALIFYEFTKSNFNFTNFTNFRAYSKTSSIKLNRASWIILLRRKKFEY